MPTPRNLHVGGGRGTQLPTAGSIFRMNTPYRCAAAAGFLRTLFDIRHIASLCQ